MRLGLISDIHGNPVALTACLHVLREKKVDVIVCLGDSVGYLPLGKEVLELIGENGIRCVKGNHEAMLLGQLPLDPERDRVYRLSLLRTNLPAPYLEQVKRFPSTDELSIHGKRLLFMHGGPHDPLNEYVYENSNMHDFEVCSYDSVFIGHTHLPFVYRSPHVLVVNAGSCGLPRDYGTLACSVIYDTESDDVEIWRIPFEAQEIVSLCDGNIHPSVLSVFDRKSSFQGMIAG